MGRLINQFHGRKAAAGCLENGCLDKPCWAAILKSVYAVHIFHVSSDCNY